MYHDELPQALTFGDVSLIPAHSDILPNQVDISISLGEKLLLHAPIMSAAMDTVTNSQMAIAMAQAGGLGVIHKNMEPAEQAREAFRVKKYEAWVIANPITIAPDATIAHAKELVKEQSVSGFPVVSNEGELLGMLTARDIRFADSSSSLVSDVMSKELVIASTDAGTELCLDLMKSRRVEKLPLVDDNRHLKGLVTIKDIHKASTFPNSVRDKRGRLCCGAAVGCGDDLEERAHALISAGVDAIVVDSAHGHSKNVFDAVKKLRSWFEDVLIIAGNVVTEEGAIFLHQAGADVIKVGVGPGSICTTRVIAGVGIPQLTGSLLAGTQEAPGERLIYHGREFKVYRGMGSIGAMGRGSKDRYGQHEVLEDKKLVPEGIEGRIPYRGRAADVVFQLMGGLKAGMGYLGAKNIFDLQTKARFVRVSPAGFREGHVHDITITKEAPNYFFSE
jgi:IMP dehydrogenase